MQRRFIGIRVVAPGVTDKDLNGDSVAARMTGESSKGAGSSREGKGRLPSGPPEGVEPFVCVRRVRFSDIDGMGHVNNAVYHSYTEEARFDWVIHEVGTKDLRAVDFILAHASIDFLAPATLGDEVRVEMWVPRIGKKSWDFAYRLTSGGGDRVFASALTTQVAFDYGKGRTKEVPERYRPFLERLHS